MSRTRLQVGHTTNRIRICHFPNYAEYWVILMLSIVPVTIKPVNTDLQRFPIILSFTSLVFMLLTV